MKLITSAILRKSSFFLMGGLTVVAGWGVFSVGYVFYKMKEPQLGKNPVEIFATSPVQRKEGAKTLPFSTTSHVRRSSARMASQPSTAGNVTATLPSASMGSVNPFHHSGAIAMSGTSHRSVAQSSSSSRGEVHSTVEDAKRAASISRGGNMLAMSSALALAAPGASYANDVSGVSSISAPGRPRRVIGDPDIPFPDPPEPETPVGPIPFAFMALLAGGYMFLRQRRREEVRGNR